MKNMVLSMGEIEKSEWLKKRNSGIGGSDAAAVIGVSKWKTNVQLWEEKTGRREPEDISENEFVKYGKESEKFLRELFILDFPEYIVNYDEFGMKANIKNKPFIFATLDGDLIEKETGRKGILEIKTTFINSSAQIAWWDNRIPDTYYIQVIHQLLATGWEFAVVKAQLKYWYDKNKIDVRHYFIERKDVIDDINFIFNKELEFWDCVEKDKRPSLILPAI